MTAVAGLRLLARPWFLRRHRGKTESNFPRGLTILKQTGRYITQNITDAFDHKLCPPLVQVIESFCILLMHMILFARYVATPRRSVFSMRSDNSQSYAHQISRSLDHHNARAQDGPERRRQLPRAPGRQGREQGGRFGLGRLGRRSRPEGARRGGDGRPRGPRVLDATRPHAL